MLLNTLEDMEYIMAIHAQIQVQNLTILTIIITGLVVMAIECFPSQFGVKLPEFASHFQVLVLYQRI